MPKTYRIIKELENRQRRNIDLAGGRGRLIAYPLEVESDGQTMQVEILRQPQSTVPQAGMMVEAEYRSPRPNAPEGSLPSLGSVQFLDSPDGAQTASQGPQTGRRTHPEDARRMGRSAAQKCATELVASFIQAGITNQDEVEVWAERVRKITDWYEFDLLRKETEEQAGIEPAKDDIPF